MEYYFLREDKKNMIAWDTFKELSECFVSDHKGNTVLNGMYIKIYKDNNRVEFINKDQTKDMWIKHDMVYVVPLLINI